MNFADLRSFSAFGIDLRLAPICGSEANLRKSVLICVENHSFSNALKEPEPRMKRIKRIRHAMKAVDSMSTPFAAIRGHSRSFALKIIPSRSP
ncbi:MAG: hypothetical protein JNJ70_04430 [Verrucomicrobiales bacterium]|nr:hypothetical protein [Verrucomicrobiales bacterium]